MEVSWNRGTPSYHPFLDGMFYEINHPLVRGTPHSRKPTYHPHPPKILFCHLTLNGSSKPPLTNKNKHGARGTPEGHGWANVRLHLQGRDETILAGLDQWDSKMGFRLAFIASSDPNPISIFFKCWQQKKGFEVSLFLHFFRTIPWLLMINNNRGSPKSSIFRWIGVPPLMAPPHICGCWSK